MQNIQQHYYTTENTYMYRYLGIEIIGDQNSNQDRSILLKVGGLDSLRIKNPNPKQGTLISRNLKIGLFYFPFYHPLATRDKMLKLRRIKNICVKFRMSCKNGLVKNTFQFPRRTLNYLLKIGKLIPIFNYANVKAFFSSHFVLQGPFSVN